MLSNYKEILNENYKFGIICPTQTDMEFRELTLQNLRQQLDIVPNCSIFFNRVLNFSYSMKHRSVVPTSETLPDIRQRHRRQLLAQIHSYLSWNSDIFSSFGRIHIAEFYILMVSDFLLNFLDGQHPITGSYQIGKNLSHAVDSDFPSEKNRAGNNPIQCTL